LPIGILLGFDLVPPPPEPTPLPIGILLGFDLVPPPPEPTPLPIGILLGFDLVPPPPEPELLPVGILLGFTLVPSSTPPPPPPWPPPTINYSCPVCVTGTWNVFRFTIAGATGDFTSMNGTWDVAWELLCQWGVQPYPGFGIVFSFFTGPPPAWCTLQLSTMGGTFQLTYMLQPSDCENPNTMPNISSTGTGSFPPTVTIYGIA
jgi:hypothetical protein